MRGRNPPPPRRNNTDPRHRWNHCWNLPIHPPILISFGRNNPKKNPHYFLNLPSPARSSHRPRSGGPQPDRPRGTKHLTGQKGSTETDRRRRVRFQPAPLILLNLIIYVITQREARCATGKSGVAFDVPPLCLSLTRRAGPARAWASLLPGG